MPRHVRPFNNDKVWPFGKETVICHGCSGTGADKRKVMAYITSRNPEPGDDLNVKCDLCEGRGRVVASAARAS